jgi:hypothetical protein
MRLIPQGEDKEGGYRLPVSGDGGIAARTIMRTGAIFAPEG